MNDPKILAWLDSDAGRAWEDGFHRPVGPRGFHGAIASIDPVPGGTYAGDTFKQWRPFDWSYSAHDFMAWYGLPSRQPPLLRPEDDPTRI